MLLHIIIIVMILFFSIAAYAEKALNKPGAVAAFLMGAILYISGGITFLAALCAFFVSSTALTKYKGKYKKEFEKELYDKTGTRDHIQVLANGGAALMIAIVHFIFPGEKTIVALFTAFAACNADTWASEIGVLSKKPPFSILTFKTMSRGISGGITTLGTLAAFAGAFFIAAFYIGVQIVFSEPVNFFRNSLYILIFGFLGAIIDSYIGATLQPLYKNSHTGRLTEKKRQGAYQNIKIKGIEFFSNDMVNFISSGLAATLVLILLK